MGLPKGLTMSIKEKFVGRRFKNVYYITQSANTATTIRPFGGAYRVENKPFFNYSGSVYLSFLVKGDGTNKDIRQ